MTVSQWSEINFPLLQAAMDRMTGYHELRHDLTQEVVLAFLTHKDAQAIVDAGGGFFYCLRIGMNLWKSTSSPFYKAFKHEEIPLDPSHENIPDLPYTEEEFHAEIDRIIDKDLSWYENMLLKEYAGIGANALALSRLTGIPRTSISLSIKRIKTHIRTKMSII